MKKLGFVLLATVLGAACGGEESGGGSGGSGTGGSGTGGSGTGGLGIGGSGTGGSATGGTATGGSSTGGSATGGLAGTGAGGTGGTTLTGGAAGASGTGGAGGDGGQCASLLETFQKALAEAVKCSAMLGVIQCSGKATLPDPCACIVVANETQQAKVKAAQDAYDAWVKAGCGPWACGKACFEGTSGECNPQSGTCQWK